MAQATYELANQQLPGAIYQQAAFSELGELAAVYKPRFSNPFFIIGAALAAIIVDIAAVIGLYNVGWVAFYLLIIPILAIIWAVNSLRACNLRVYIFTNGFIHARGKSGEAVRWDQIQAIWEKVTRSRYSNTFLYTVQRSDGKVFRQGSPLVNCRDMGVRMMREVTKVHLPAAKAAYNAGQTLTFGPVNVTMQGLNNGKEMVPWDQIGRITLQQGKLGFEKEGRTLTLSSVKTADIPNLSVLIALVNSVVQGQK